MGRWYSSHKALVLYSKLAVWLTLKSTFVVNFTNFLTVQDFKFQPKPTYWLALPRNQIPSPPCRLMLSETRTISEDISNYFKLHMLFFPKTNNTCYPRKTANRTSGRWMCGSSTDCRDYSFYQSSKLLVLDAKSSGKYERKLNLVPSHSRMINES